MIKTLLVEVSVSPTIGRQFMNIELDQVESISTKEKGGQGQLKLKDGKFFLLSNKEALRLIEAIKKNENNSK